MGVIIVDGTKKNSKLFVRTAEELGYAVRKINPQKATREVVRIILPRYHEEDTLFFREAEEFLRRNNAYLHYIQKSLREPFDLRDRDRKTVSILVNISKGMRNILQEEEGIHHILVADEKPENENGYDRVIESSKENFEERVASTLRILSK